MQVKEKKAFNDRGQKTLGLLSGDAWWVMLLAATPAVSHRTLLHDWDLPVPSCLLACLPTHSFHSACLPTHSFYSPCFVP